MIPTILPTIHVAMSLVGLFAGYLCVFGLFLGKVRSGWTATSVTMTVTTSIMGVLFSQNQIIPVHVVSLVSSLGLAATTYDLVSKPGVWRDHLYVGAACSLALNLFVGTTQAFQAIPLLEATAQAQGDPFFVLLKISITGLILLLGWRLGLSRRPTICLPSANRPAHPWILPTAKKHPRLT